jgi:hypothetical protein
MQATATTLHKTLQNGLLYMSEKWVGINLETKSYQSFKMPQIWNSVSSLITFQMPLLYLVSYS